ncbi:YeaC family protein [Litchfieldella rifensis]|uniref:YeaC family protein n=1 Tax=Litchfieldella rifensis TaxID=762643 RepID=A0ABV7LLB8_9GAMM
MSEMTFDRMIQQMTPAIHESLKQAVALRKWPDGRRLSAEQVELCLEAVIKYEAEHDVPPEQRVGFLERTSCGSDGGDDIKWVN